MGVWNLVNLTVETGAGSSDNHSDYDVDLWFVCTSSHTELEDTQVLECSPPALLIFVVKTWSSDKDVILVESLFSLAVVDVLWS